MLLIFSYSKGNTIRVNLVFHSLLNTAIKSTTQHYIISKHGIHLQKQHTFKQIFFKDFAIILNIFVDHVPQNSKLPPFCILKLFSAKSTSSTGNCHRNLFLFVTHYFNTANACLFKIYSSRNLFSSQCGDPICDPTCRRESTCLV